jgi:hypothetical protein
MLSLIIYNFDFVKGSIKEILNDIIHINSSDELIDYFNIEYKTALNE